MQSVVYLYVHRYVRHEKTNSMAKRNVQSKPPTKKQRYEYYCMVYEAKLLMEKTRIHSTDEGVQNATTERETTHYDLEYAKKQLIEGAIYVKVGASLVFLSHSFGHATISFCQGIHHCRP